MVYYIIKIMFLILHLPLQIVFIENTQILFVFFLHLSCYDAYKSRPVKTYKKIIKKLCSNET